MTQTKNYFFYGCLASILINIAVAFFVLISFHYRFFPPAIENMLGSFVKCLAVIATWSIVCVITYISGHVRIYAIRFITIMSMSFALLWFILMLAQRYSAPLTHISLIYDMAIVSYALVMVGKKKQLAHYMIAFYLFFTFLQYIGELLVCFGFCDYWTDFYYSIILSVAQAALLISFVINVYRQYTVQTH